MPKQVGKEDDAGEWEPEERFLIWIATHWAQHCQERGDFTKALFLESMANRFRVHGTLDKVTRDDPEAAFLIEAFNYATTLDLQASPRLDCRTLLHVNNMLIQMEPYIRRISARE
jgi:hypothetical protein